MSFKFTKICSKWHCCEVETMFGHSLKEGVVFVGVASLIGIITGTIVQWQILLKKVLSLVMLFSTLGCHIFISRSDSLFNMEPMVAENFIFTLVAPFLSSYQIIISLLLLWQAKQKKGNIFICSLWYVSHISLLSMYFLLFSSKVVVCSLKRHHFIAVFTIIIGVIYESAFIYFAIVVNSYLHSLNQERYL